jgi:hypothetical protein
MIDLNTYQLGKTDQILHTDSKNNLQQLILTMSQQARQRILIFSHALDHHLFDNPALYEHIKKLAIANRRTYIQILIQNSQPMSRKGHCLLTLTRRLSSHIQIKITAKEHRNVIENFIIFDDRGYIFQENPERFDAQGNFYDPLKTRQLTEQFTQLWEYGMMDSTLRQLSL